MNQPIFAFQREQQGIQFESWRRGALRGRKFLKVAAFKSYLLKKGEFYTQAAHFLRLAWKAPPPLSITFLKESVNNQKVEMIYEDGSILLLLALYLMEQYFCTPM